jgi:acetyl-CoA C-acetyltransferase
MQEVYIVDIARTAIGSFNGSLAQFKAHELSTKLITSIISRNNIDPIDISEVILGQVLVAAQGQNPARQAAILSGIPNEVPAWQVSHVCGSGLKSIALAAQAIRSGESELVIAGGHESMSQAVHATYLRAGVKMGHSELCDTMIKDGLWDAFNNYHMGVTAENIAKKYNISREEQDHFALNSQLKAGIAVANKKFTDEIIAIETKPDILFDTDEYIKANITIEKLAKLKPAFDKLGSVTAGNASGINDGAAILMLANERMVKKYNLNIIAKITSFAQTGVNPEIMGIGPVSASKKALEKAKWNIDDLDLIEANEAFAAQAIAVNREMRWDESKVNINGGAIAIGHPIGASGARVTVSLLSEMKKNKNIQKSLATLCIGGGMGIAMCFEKI